MRHDKKDWHLIRNDNGEWISDDYAVFVDKMPIKLLQANASKNGKPLSIHHGPEGSLWCYKIELEEIESPIQYPKVETRE